MIRICLEIVEILLRNEQSWNNCFDSRVFQALARFKDASLSFSILVSQCIILFQYEFWLD